MTKMLLTLFLVITWQFVSADSLASITSEQSNSITFADQLLLATKGNTAAQAYVGFAHLKGLGTVKDIKQAMHWLEKAAKNGNADAQGRLGEIYAHGIDVTLDYQKAIFWYKKAMDQHDVTAIANLGSVYCNPKEDIPRIIEVCFALYSLAAKRDPLFNEMLSQILPDISSHMTKMQIDQSQQLSMKLQQTEAPSKVLDEFIQHRNSY